MYNEVHFSRMSTFEVINPFVTLVNQFNLTLPVPCIYENCFEIKIEGTLMQI